jgi:GT2 family glycosyltransferase
LNKSDVPQVAVIILCWNNKDLLDECIESVNKQTYPNVLTIMVDNGSKDDSVAHVEKHHKNVRVIETGANLGFAIGNNIGMKAALENPDCKYVVLLNTDAVIDPDWVEKMVAFAGTHPKLASAQSLTVDYYNHKIIDSCGILIDRQALATQMGYRQMNVRLETRRVFGANAAAALFTRNFLDAQPFGDDYLDHDLWMYLEDVDIATRAIMMGWENWFVNESKAYHMGSASSGKNPGFSLRMTYRNNALVLIKNLPFRIIMKTLPGMMRAELSRLRGFWRERKYKEIQAMVKGRFQSIPRIPIFLKKRHEFKKYWKISEQDLWALMELPKLKKLPPEELPYGSESVAVIMLSHNNKDQLERSLGALTKEKYPNMNITVVDIGSTDGSAQFIEDKYPKVNLLAQRSNLGIPNGFNVGLTNALREDSDYFALIQANIVISAGWIDAMIHTMRKYPSAFAVSSKVVNQDGEVINQGYDYHPQNGATPVTFKGDRVREVFAASDLAGMFRVEKMGMVGMMDGDFFSGLEDVDFCFRARLAGRQIYSQPKALALSLSDNELKEKVRWYQTQKNLFYIYVKDMPFKVFVKYFPQALAFTGKSYATAIKRGLILQQLKALAKCVYRLPRMLRYRRHVNIHRRERSVKVDKMLREEFGKS